MSDPIRVLVYGSIGHGVCDTYRLGMYRERLRALGVDMRTWGDFNDYRVQVPRGYEDRLADAFREGVARIDWEPVAWADVIVFRRWYPLSPACATCDTVGPSDAAIEAHCRAAGHEASFPDRLAPALLDEFEQRPEILNGRAIVYETDDDLFSAQPWVNYHRRLQPDRWLVERLARRADLITTTTPVLAATLRRFNDEVRVVRNAVDLGWYQGAAAAPRDPDAVRVLYYGAPVRLRDYRVCQDAVDDLARRDPRVRRLWLGGDDTAIRAVVDEALPYVEGLPAFARALVAARPDIGLAPVLGDDFDRARSELHWLEYSMAGAATVASRTLSGGPYDVIRDGVDGLLARNKAQWREQLRRLAASPSLREDLAARARERVVADYSADQRAVEWAEAYRWAAEHGGRGALPRLHALGSRATAASAVAAEAGANLRHRQRTRREAAEAAAELARLRGDGDVCWPDAAGHDPLVTVSIAVDPASVDRAARAVSSALAQTHRNIEVLVACDGAGHAIAERLCPDGDPRVRIVDPGGLGHGGVDGVPAGLGALPADRVRRLARGAWIAPLDPGDEFTPDHVEVLLGLALEYRLEMVYGTCLVAGDGGWLRVGAWPPQEEGLCHGAALYAAPLAFMPYDPESWRLGEAVEWNLWRRMLEAGVRMGHADVVVLTRQPDRVDATAAIAARA